jgi:hypothetical protein
METGTFESEEWILDFALDGDRAFASGKILRVLDLAASGAPAVLAELTRPGTTFWDIAVDGPRLYAVGQVNSESGTTYDLSIFDVDAAGQLAELGQLALEAELSTLAAADGYLYAMAYRPTGEGFALTVIDARDPSRPQVLGSVALDGSAYPHDIQLDGGLLYLARAVSGPAEDGSLEIFDIADPVRPRLLGIQRGVKARSVHVTGGRAFVAQSLSDVRVFDVSDPTAPRDSGASPFAPNTQALDGSGQLLVTAGRGIRWFDVSDPDRPRDLGALSGTTDMDEVRVSGWRVLGGAGGKALVAYLFEDPSLSGVATVADGWGDLDDQIGGDVALSGTYAVVAAGDAGVRVLDARVPADVVEIGRLDGTAWYASRVELSWPLALVAAGWQGGMRVLDMSDPRRPRERGAYIPESHEPDGWTQLRFSAMAAAGSYAVVAVSRSNRSADLGGRIDVVSLVEPDIPAAVASLEIEIPTGGAHRVLADVAASAGRAYVLGPDWLAVIDLTDPSAPRQLGAIAAGGTMQDVRVAGDHAFVASSDGLRAFDVSEPSAIRLVTTVPLPIGGSEPTRVALARVDDRRLAAVTWPGGIRVLDVEDPGAWWLVGSYADAPGWRYSGTSLGGWWLYVATDRAGLNVYAVDQLETWFGHRAYLPLAAFPNHRY